MPRLQRFLAEAGVAARRKAEALIVEGRVRVNGQVAELGSRVDPTRDRVEVDGKRIVAERKSYLLLNKPRGYVATLQDPEGRPTVMQLLPEDGPRIYPVGRLDYNTEGLLLFTNDGDLANGLMHPRRQVEKTYHLKLRDVLTAEDVKTLEEGIELDGAPRKARVAGGGVGESGKYSWAELVITEGRNRQVHRMMEALGHQISRLVRVGYGPLTTKGLRVGKWRRLEPEELRALAELAGSETPFEARERPTRASPGKLQSRPHNKMPKRPAQRPAQRPSSRPGTSKGPRSGQRTGKPPGPRPARTPAPRRR